MIVLFPLWRRRWWVESVLDSDDRLDAARSLYWHAVMNRPNKLVILCKRARVLARSDHPETMQIQVEPGIPTELPAASRRPGPSKTRSAAIHRCGKNGARLRRPQCGRMRRKLDAIATHCLGAIERLICHIQEGSKIELASSEIATPPLAVAESGPSANVWVVASNAARNRSANKSTSWRVVSGSRLANCSPPIRPNRSVGRRSEVAS
jgi:hypothetical protein